jgi:ribokinase
VSAGAARVAVVGHVEWVDFAVVDRLPRQGEILHARETFAAPGGGGAVAAVHLARLASSALFLTAVGGDAAGAEAARRLAAVRGLETHAAVRAGPQRRAFTYLDAAAERTITVLGERLVPHGDDALPWDRLARCDAVYFTGGDVPALRAARAARVVVATPRALDTLAAAGVQLDVLVASAGDPGEAVEPGRIEPRPRHVVLTEGPAGGAWTAHDGATGRWAAAAPPGPPLDAYGCGDAFAAGLTYALGSGAPLADALAAGARAGAAVLALRGPYGR